MATVPGVAGIQHSEHSETTSQGDAAKLQILVPSSLLLQRSMTLRALKPAFHNSSVYKKMALTLMNDMTIMGSCRVLGFKGLVKCVNVENREISQSDQIFHGVVLLH